MRSLVPKRNLLAGVVIAVVAGTASAAGVAVAQGNGTTSSVPTVTTSAPGSILAGVHHALEQLVAQGTITQPQADAVQQQADGGSIDPKTLVDSGVVSGAQMRAVANSIDQVKQAAGG